MTPRATLCLLPIVLVSACSGEKSAPATHTPSTAVFEVYPSGAVIPENQLRMYVQFSGPMGRQSGLSHIALLDDEGHEISGAIRPLDTELWNSERTRYTLLLDQGGVKRGIPRSRGTGDPLRKGQAFTFVVKTDWLDARGAPLASEFRRKYRVGPADEQPLSTLAWRILPPPPGTRDAVTISFPKPLDHALLQRAIGVSHAGANLAGDVTLANADTEWAFVPREAWQPGIYTVIVLPILEDLAGNRIGRAFEVQSPGEPVPAEDSEPVNLPFRIAPAYKR